MTTSVSFPIAKLLKEKGFDKKSKYHYPNLSDNQEVCTPIDWNNFTDMASNSNYYTAPTIAEVVMWLYEKHDIWIEVRKSYLLNQFVAVTKNPRIELSAKDSPTEAYEAAITYALTNLIP